MENTPWITIAIDHWTKMRCPIRLIWSSMGIAWLEGVIPPLSSGYRVRFYLYQSISHSAILKL